MYNGSVKNTYSGPWNVVAQGDAPSFTNFLYVQALADNEDEISFRYESYNGPSIMMLKLNPSGKIQRLIWNERSSAWDVQFSAPGICDTYGICGANIICSPDNASNCECFKGFKLKSEHNQTQTRKCIGSHSSNCKSGDQFVKLDDIKAPDLLEVSLTRV